MDKKTKDCLTIMVACFTITFGTLFMFNDQIKAKSIELLGTTKQQVQKVETAVTVAIKIGEPQFAAKVDAKKNNSCNNCNRGYNNHYHNNCWHCHGRRPLLRAAGFTARVALAPLRFIFCR